jgi:flavin reductase (DIM6/NTAB) family NADH-FMN oxidoreductase RutF
MGSEIAGRAGVGMPEDSQPVVLPAGFERAGGVVPDEDAARWLRRHYPSGVTVVASGTQNGYSGVTVSSFAYVSLDPLLVFIALGTESQTGERIGETGYFGVSMLTNRHRFLADRFAGRAPLVDRRFADVSFRTAATGAPLLSDSIAWLDCRVDAQYPGGDHTIFIGRVEAVGHGSGDEDDPLIYFESSYRRLQ